MHPSAILHVSSGAPYWADDADENRDIFRSNELRYLVYGSVMRKTRIHRRYNSLAIYVGPIYLMHIVSRII